MPSQKAFMSGSVCPPLPSDKLRLYSMRLCPYAERTRLVLEHKNIEYETVNIHLRNKPEWYIADINPLGKVPSIQCGDRIVYDSVIVDDYLDEIYPQNKLTPADPLQQAKDRMILERASAMTGPFYKVFRAGGQTSEDIAPLFDAIEFLEHDLKTRGSKFFGGKGPMMLDYNLWPHFERLDAFQSVNTDIKLDAKRFPVLVSWIENMKTVPAVKAVITSHEIYAKLYMGIRKSEFDYDLGLEE